MKLFNLIIGTSFITGVATPALAQGLSNPTLGSQDVILYDVQGQQTFANPNASLTNLLSGNASSPTGNIELFASSESTGFSGTATTLSGDLNGTSLILSSLTKDDWQDGGFAQQWFSDFLDVALNRTGQQQRAAFGDANLYSNLFVPNGGRELFSDPNISYVNQQADGTVAVGLAGHFDATPIIGSRLPNLAPFLKSSIQASEIVKVVYDNGPAQYLYSFSATPSGLTERSDGISHSGNYEVTFSGHIPPSQSVPEPTTAVALGLAAVAGVAVRKQSTP